MPPTRNLDLRAHKSRDKSNEPKMHHPEDPPASLPPPKAVTQWLLPRVVAVPS